MGNRANITDLDTELQALRGTGDATASATDSAVTLVLTLAYNGAAYSGFARQKDPRLHTIQGELERAIATVFRRPVETVCAGRTDAGVHALGQVVSCEVTADELAGREKRKLLTSLNALTPDDIVVRGLRLRPSGFSARFDAVRREYRYRIVTGGAPALFLRDFAWWHRAPLDVDAMRAGAAFLLGEHDFKSFCKTQSAEGKNTVREVERIELFSEEQLGEECLVVRVVGNAFLHSMIRTIVGTLVQVGRGHRDPTWVGKVLAARDRSAAGENAPAHGLTFWHVDY